MTMENTKAKNFHISRFFTKSAIEAMEEACHAGASDRESCDDVISRRAVLDTLDKMDSVLDEDRTVETYKELLAACYKDLPSVTSVYKKEWIPVTERLPKAPSGTPQTLTECDDEDAEIYSDVFEIDADYVWHEVAESEEK